MQDRLVLPFPVKEKSARPPRIRSLKASRYCAASQRASRCGDRGPGELARDRTRRLAGRVTRAHAGVCRRCSNLVMVFDGMRGPSRRRTQVCIGQLELATVSDHREHESGCGEGKGQADAWSGARVSAEASTGFTTARRAAAARQRAIRCVRSRARRLGNEELRIPRCLR
jgi:hypothetical protein